MSNRRISKRALYQEFIAGRTVFDWCFLGLGIVLQIIVFVWSQSSTLAFISAVTGIINVILCSQKKISAYLFGFLCVTTYTYLAYEEKLWLEVSINIFYLITMIWGIFEWKKNYTTKDNSAELQTKRLSLHTWIISIVAIVTISILTGYLTAAWTNDSQPYMDALTTIPAILAQILMVKGYREQWFFWLLIDIGLTIVWLRAGDYCLALQYAFWSVNCIYGFLKWSK